MFDVIAVTNRRLCETDFLKQIEEIAAAGVSSVILRERILRRKPTKRLQKRYCGFAGNIPCPAHCIILQTWRKTLA